MGLETFVPEPREIEIAGRKLSITPLKMREVPGFTKAIAPAMSHLVTGNLNGALLWHAEAVIGATAIGARVDRGWIDGLDPDVFLPLVAAVFEVNTDFFARLVLPQIRAAAQGLTAAIQASLGASGSPGSDDAAGGLPTSST
jgi:hypothetical protein